jgi:hypothetical protein
MTADELSRDIEELRRGLHQLSVRTDEIKVNQGVILARMNRQLGSRRLKDYQFKVFSQWGEDGIIQRLVETVEITVPTFIEFGVEDFTESNCRFLMIKDSWRGFVIDASSAHIKKIRKAAFTWRHGLVAHEARITAENINELLALSGLGADLGILSIDLDGNDYHVLEAITVVRPRILICEYNALFGPSRKLTVPYDPQFQRTHAHSSNLYWGASIAAITAAAARKGYQLVGGNTAGNNAFFVRSDLMSDGLEALSPAEAYAPPCFRESRDAEGRLTHLGPEEGLALIRGLPVLDLDRGEVVAL